MVDRLLDRIQPFHASSKIVRSGETLIGFVWRASGVHQFYAGALAVLVALLGFVPIDLQRRIVDGAIADQSVSALITLGLVYLGVLVAQSALKYILQLYQGWVGESAVKTSRDQLAKIAAERHEDESAEPGQTVNVIGREIDNVGGFVGTSISEFIINVTLLVAVSGYMVYIEPIIAAVSALFLIPQVFLALFMQRRLNRLVERQVTLIRKLGDDAVQADQNEEPHTIRAIFGNRMRFNVLKFGLKALLNIANAMGPLMVLMVGGYLVIGGQTTIGTVVAFVSGFERISGPLRDLLDFYREYQQAKVQHRMIVQWVENKVDPVEGTS